MSCKKYHQSFNRYQKGKIYLYIILRPPLLPNFFQQPQRIIHTTEFMRMQFVQLWQRVYLPLTTLQISYKSDIYSIQLVRILRLNYIHYAIIDVWRPSTFFSNISTIFAHYIQSQNSCFYDQIQILLTINWHLYYFI